MMSLAPFAKNNYKYIDNNNMVAHCAVQRKNYGNIEFIQFLESFILNTKEESIIRNWGWYIYYIL